MKVQHDGVMGSSRELPDLPPADIAESYDMAASHYDGWKWQKIWALTEWPGVATVLGHPTAVLELGVGTGMVAERVIQQLDGAVAYVGVDISGGMLEVCRRKLGNKIDLIEADAAKVKLAAGRFDMVLMCRMLAHVNMPESVFANVAPALVKGGWMIVTEIDPQHPYTITPIAGERGAGLMFRYINMRPRDIVAAAKACGMHCVDRQTVFADEALVPEDVKRPSTLDGVHRPLLNRYIFEKA